MSRLVSFYSHDFVINTFHLSSYYPVWNESFIAEFGGFEEVDVMTKIPMQYPDKELFDTIGMQKCNAKEFNI